MCILGVIVIARVASHSLAKPELYNSNLQILDLQAWNHECRDAGIVKQDAVLPGSFFIRIQ